MLPLVVSKSDLGHFFAYFPKLLAVIKTIAKKIMLPTIFSESPEDPENNFLLVLRNAKSLQKFTIDKSYIYKAFSDPKKLYSLYTVKSIKFKSHDLESRRTQLYGALKATYRRSGLMLLGGIQDPVDRSQVHMLLFKNNEIVDSNVFPDENTIQ